MTCHHEESRVMDSRRTEDGKVLRRRKCLACGERFSTVEITRSEYDDLKARVQKLRNALMALQE